MSTILKEGIIKTKQELEYLNQIIHSVVGQQCWNIRRGYGGVYTFDFGKKREIHGSYMGEFYFSTHGTNFTLTDAKNMTKINTLQCDIDDPQTVNDIKNDLNHLLNTTVSSTQIDYETLGISVKFSNAYALEIVPTAQDNHYDEPYWSFSFPENKFLAIKPFRQFVIEQQ